MHCRTAVVVLAAIVVLVASSAFADPFTYQGQLKVNGAAPSANYDFQFSIYDAQAPGGALIAGPLSVSNVPASAGLFTVQLDFGIAPFDGSTRYLEIAVQPAGGNGYTTLSSRQLLTAAPYSLFSKTGSATQLQTRAVSAGAPAAGQVLKWSGAAWAPAADSDTTYSAGAGLQLSGTMFSIANNGVTNVMLANDPLSLSRVSGGTMSANSGIPFVGIGRSTQVTGADYFALQAPAAAGSFGGMYIETTSTTGKPFYGYALPTSPNLTLAYHYLDGNDNNKWKLSNGGEWLSLTRSGVLSVGNGAVDKVQIDGTNGDVTFTDPNASITFPATAGANSPMIQMFATGAANADRMVIAHSSAFQTYGLQYQDSSEKFNFLSAGLPVLTADLQHHRVGINTSTPTQSMEIDDSQAVALMQTASNVNGSVLVMRNNAANSTYLGATNFVNSVGGTVGQIGYLTSNDMTFRVNGIERMRIKSTGETSVNVLEITGADLAEKFPASEELTPGMVAAIDPAHPGKLCVARGAYNRAVAGVVSGANHFSVGAVLGNLPGEEKGPPIALSGRVYVNCDATENAIEPADLLTTANLPGYAMKVVDSGRAAGAILGKAMTGLKKGERGLVLVLVNLQ